MNGLLRILVCTLVSVLLVGCCCRSSYYDPYTNLIHGRGFERQKLGISDKINGMLTQSKIRQTNWQQYDYQPHANVGSPPYTSEGHQPHANVGSPPYTSEGYQPHANVGSPPYTSEGHQTHILAGYRSQNKEKRDTTGCGHNQGAPSCQAGRFPAASRTSCGCGLGTDYASVSCSSSCEPIISGHPELNVESLHATSRTPCGCGLGADYASVPCSSSCEPIVSDHSELNVESLPMTSVESTRILPAPPAIEEPAQLPNKSAVPIQDARQLNWVPR